MDLAAFLAGHTPLAEGTGVWADGLIHLEIKGYVTPDEPPGELVTSVRSLVFWGDDLLVVRNQHSAHIVPGGRRESGESFEETLRREVLEEAGWTIGGLTRLGFCHLRHLTPKPPDYPFPHPDFFWVVYLAEALTFVPNAKLDGDYEYESFFCPVAEAKGLGLTPYELLFLDTAGRSRA